MKAVFTALLAAALLSLTGCLSYSHHDLAQVEQWPLTASVQPTQSAYVKVDSQYLFNDQTRAGGFNQANLEKLVVTQYQDSKRFSNVTTAKQKADIYISVRVSNHERGSLASAFITGFTLFVIPGKFSNELSMETTFKDGDGKVLGRIEKRETITTWMQLLLIVAVPFNESIDPILNQLTQSSLEEAARQKLI